MNHREAAISLLEDFDAHKPGTIFERTDLNLRIDDAYGLQFEVAAMREARGERVAGYKVGCISDTMQRQLGISSPVFGHVWESEVFRSGVQVSAKNFDGLAIEGELAVRIQDDIPSSAWLKNNPEVISGYQPVIELHNYVFRGAASDRAVELIANNAIHAGVVLADRTIGAAEFKPYSVLQVDRNAERLGESIASHLADGALPVVVAVSEHLERHGFQLKRDQIVLTGSPLPLWPVGPGDRIRVRCNGCTEVFYAEVFCAVTE